MTDIARTESRAQSYLYYPGTFMNNTYFGVILTDDIIEMKDIQDDEELYGLLEHVRILTGQKIVVGRWTEKRFWRKRTVYSIYYPVEENYYKLGWLTCAAGETVFLDRAAVVNFLCGVIYGNKLTKGTGMIHTIYVWAEHTSRAGYVAHIDREEFEENPYDYEEISGTKEELLEAAERYRRQNSTFSTRVAQAIEDYL